MKMNLKNIKNQTQGHILYDFLYRKYSEQVNPFGQKEDWWLPEAGGNIQELTT